MHDACLMFASPQSHVLLQHHPSLRPPPLLQSHSRLKNHHPFHVVIGPPAMAPQILRVRI
jgi:hypothetical protein